MYDNVVEVNYNWHVHPEHGSNFGFYRVGERYERFPLGMAKCDKIEIDFDEGMHAIVYFDNGDVEYQWNLNKIIEQEPNVHNPNTQHQGNTEVTTLPQSNTSQAQI